MATNWALPALKFPLSIATFSCICVLGAHAQDPPTRVADLNYIDGSVSMQPAGDSEWSPAMINRPFTTGDYLWTDTNSRAELHLDGAALRLSPESSVGILNLDDRIAQLRFTQGEFVLSVRYVGDGESFEVDTPNAAITIVREGEYRFNADPNSATTAVVVRRGEAEVTGGGQSFVVSAGNSAQLSGTDQMAFNVEYAPPADEFESWSEDRDAQEAHVQSARYLPPGVIGYEELDSYGAWREVPGYGAVWYPAVDASWAPYRYGHWAWIEPWGWTWVDDAPWGFAPFHYGRWAYIGGAWGWVPGPVAVVAGGPPVMRPVYAPALVAFIGGGGWGASLSIGGPAVGWVALGPGELYAPAYRVSPVYFRTINVSNTTVVTSVNITTVYNNVYVNRTPNAVVNQRFANMAAPNAVTAVPQNAFASGRPVRQVGITVPRNQVAQLHPDVMQVRPQVTAIRQQPSAAGMRPVARPPARAIAAPVVAKSAPPRTPGAMPVRVAPPARSVVAQPHAAQPAAGGFRPQTVPPPHRLPEQKAPPKREESKPKRDEKPKEPRG